MLFVIIRLVMPVVVNCYVRLRCSVDSSAVSLKTRTMTVSVAIVVCHKKKSVDHFVNERVDEIATRSKLEKRLRKTNDAVFGVSTTLIVADASASVHTFAPF